MWKANREDKLYLVLLSFLVFLSMIRLIFTFNAFTDYHISQNILYIKSGKISYSFEVYLSQESISEILNFLILSFKTDFLQLS